MTRPAALLREWRQFRLLSRDSVRRLIASAVLSRDADPMQFALWTTALAAVPPTLIGFLRLWTYSIPWPPDVLERVLLGDRLFFVIYGMTASALIAALMWEALFPDRLDHEVVGPLPVRPRTVAGGGLAAALFVCVAFAAAVCLPSGLMFALISATNPLVGFAPQIFAAHVAATTAACLFVFVTFVALRGLVAMSAGAGLANRLAVVLQLVALMGLVQVVVQLPGALPALVSSQLEGDALARAAPPIWFAGLYSWMAGWEGAILPDLAANGARAVLVALAVVVPIYLAPARLMARRALESPSRHGSRRLWDAVRHAAGAGVRTPRAAAVCGFTLASLIRNRRQRLIVVGYTGVALAIGSAGLMAEALRETGAFASPAVHLLSAPLVLLFFLVYGLRAAYMSPTDLDANWPFRLSPPAVAHVRAATRLTLLLLAVVPVAALTALAALIAGWGAMVAMALAAFNLTAGRLLVECALVGWDRVPFACPHVPNSETVRSRWMLYAVPFAAFAFAGAAVQLAALRSLAGTALYVAAGLAVTVLVRRSSERRMARSSLTFDPPPPHEAQVLDLSGALH